MDDVHGLRCGKCEAKAWLLAARLAERRFPRVARRYVVRAANLLPARAMLWQLNDLRREVSWYIEQTQEQRKP